MEILKQYKPKFIINYFVIHKLVLVFQVIHSHVPFIFVRTNETLFVSV